MTDLVKGVLGDSRALIVGWILPVFIALQLGSVLVLPALDEISAVDRFIDQAEGTRQLALLASAAVIGLTLAAAQAPLYRLLEGYLLWPAPIVDRRIAAHQERRRRLVKQQQEVAQTTRGVRSGLVYERAARYPAQDRQFAPTLLGNAIRRFETYAGDRYRMDSQLLWHHLTSAAPERAVAAVDNARVNSDFFVALIYSAAATGLFGLGVVVAGEGDGSVWLAIAGSVVVAVASYRLAVLATDEWDAAVRALVDHGRAGVAAAFGLTVPSDLEQERLMWRAVNTLVRRPYSYSESKDVAGILARFRSGPAAAPKAAGQTTDQEERARRATVREDTTTAR